MKYINTYLDTINESIGKGSVILIKGKSDGEKRRLYAAHVTGTAELRPGAKMLFLTDPFYRIIEQDGKLKALKISYRSEAQLKAALNLKADGKISIVQNNSKTPYHWKTGKHQVIHTALRELEEELIGSSDYLLEAVQEASPREKIWEDFWNEVVSSTIKSIFYGEKAIDVLRYSVEPREIVDRALENAQEYESTTASTEWELEVTVLCRGNKYQEALDYFNMEPTISLIFFLQSTVDFTFSHDPGDYWTPPSYDYDVRDIETEILDVMVEGDDSDSTSETAALIKGAGGLIAKMDDDELSEFIKRNTKNQLFLR